MELDDIEDLYDLDEYQPDILPDGALENKDVSNIGERDTKITAPVMTEFEKITVLAERVKQLDNNYSTTIPDEVRAKNLSKSIDIALREFELRMIPNCKIKRTFPDGSYESWSIDEFLEIP